MMGYVPDPKNAGVGGKLKKGEGSMNDLVCYCFGHTAEDIRKDVEENGASTIMEKIMAEKREGGCNCADTNPNGR